LFRIVLFLIGFLVVSALFEPNSWPYYVAIGILYFFLQPFQKRRRSGKPVPTVPPVTALPPERDPTPESAPPDPSPDIPPSAASPRANALEGSSAAWIDPRCWATLVRAYALFLVIATIAEYGKAAHLVLSPWIPSPREAEESAIFLRIAYLGLFLSPFLMSQCLIAAWVASVAGAGKFSASVPRAVGIASELVSARGGAWRRPKVVVGGVAQPVLVSLFAKPILVLPRQGIDYFRYHLDAGAETAFRSVILHELGHLESWDDILFLPWFCYGGAAAAICAFGAVLAFERRLDSFQLLGNAVVLAALFVLGFYVVRRREAYSDAYAVVSTRTTEGLRLALSAVAQEGGRARAAMNTHFDAARRLNALAERGRSFVDMSRVDIGIFAFMYFGLDTEPLREMAHGGGMMWVAGMWLDAFANFVLLVLMLLVFGGLTIARQGRPPRVRELAPAAVICLLGLALLKFFSGGIFNLLHIGMALSGAALELVIGVPFFILGGRVLSRWMLGMLLPRRAMPAEHLLWSVLLVVAPFTVISSVLEQVLYRSMGSLNDIRHLSKLIDLAPREMVAAFLPAFLVVISIWAVRACFFAGIAFWAWRRTRSLAEVRCLACDFRSAPSLRACPLLPECPHCGSVLRPDLVLDLRSSAA
jgi:Zn-dependent protease with chaperone function